MISTTCRRHSLYKLDGGASASAARRESGLISGGGRTLHISKSAYKAVLKDKKGGGGGLEGRGRKG